MADYCDYIIHVRGTKKAALMVFATMRCADDKPISYEGGTDEEYIIHFSGSCKWEPDAYCDKEWNGEEIDLNVLDEGAIRNEDGIDDFMFYPLKDMSAMFHCEIEIYECYPDNEVCSFTHYKDGDTLEEEYSAIDYEYDDGYFDDDEEIEDVAEIEEEENEEDDEKFDYHGPIEDLTTRFDF